MESMATDFHFYNLLEKHIPTCNGYLEELAFPQVEDPDDWSMEETVDHIRWSLSEKKLRRASRHLHHNHHPLAQLYPTKDALDQMKDHLYRHVSHARRRIRRGWKKGRWERMFSDGVGEFWASLQKGTQKPGNASEFLRTYLSKCLGAVMEDRGFDPTQNHHLSLKSIYHRQPSIIGPDDTAPVGWQVMEAGLMAGFGYYLLDVDDMAAVENMALPLEEHLTDGAIDLIDGINWDLIGTVSFPLLGSVRQAHRQISRVMDDQISLREAGINFSITISSRIAGATLGVWVGKSMGSMLYPGAGTVAGSVIGGGVGSLLGGQIARDIVTWRYRKAVKRYEDIRRKMEHDIERRTERYLDRMQVITRKAQEALDQDRERLRLKIPDTRPLEALRQDIIQTLGDEEENMNFEHAARYRQLMEELEAAPLSRVSALLLKHRDLPMRRRGQMCRSRRAWQNAIRDWNAKISLGLTGWIYLMRGIFHAQVKEIYENITFSEDMLRSIHERAAIKLHNQREKIIQRHAQFSR